MLRLNLTSRSLHLDNFKTALRSFCSKGVKDNSDAIPESEAVGNKEATAQNDDMKANANDGINLKINSILQSMIENKDKEKSTFQTAININDIGTRHKNKRKEKAKNKKVDESKQLIRAAKTVAETIGENEEKIEQEILSKAMNPDMRILNWGELISGMPIDNSESTDTYQHSKAQQVRSALGDKAQLRSAPSSLQQPKYRSKVQKINLFDGAPLDIFKDRPENKDIQLEAWSKFEKQDLELTIAQPPANYFEKMIKWTKEGKVWKFPIDNEQGLEEEQNVHFSEHIFLENHLDWCPKKGPIRHFMELVCVGMSKNPYMPVQDKIDHINWFRDYFDSYKELLKETGALGEPPTKPTQLSE